MARDERDARLFAQGDNPPPRPHPATTTSYPHPSSTPKKCHPCPHSFTGRFSQRFGWDVMTRERDGRRRQSESAN